MQNLPFLQAPPVPKMRKCGNLNTGILEFPVLGGLTVGESLMIDKLSGNQESSLSTSARKAQLMAKIENISLAEAFSIIEKAMSGGLTDEKQIAIAEKHGEIIDELRLFYAQLGAKTQTATVLTLIRCRLGLPEWNDLEHLPKPLFNDIWQLAQDEIAQEEQPTQPAPTEDELGKPQTVSKNGTKPITTASVGN